MRRYTYHHNYLRVGGGQFHYYIMIVICWLCRYIMIISMFIVMTMDAEVEYREMEVLYLS